MTEPGAPARSRLVTLLAWLLMAAGALLTPISAISLLMLLVGSYGSQSTTLSGFLVVVVLPPATALAGLGLWRRARPAYLGVLLLLGGIAVSNVATMLHGPTEAHTEYGADGVPTHVSGSEVGYAWHAAVVLVSLGVLAGLLLPSVRAEFPAPRAARTAPRPTPPPRAPEPPAPQPEPILATAVEMARGWRVGHRGRDEMYYEELCDGRWERITISGEMLMGRAHHVIWFASPREWLAYPEWARHRRAEIVARVKSELRPPDYEYDDDGPAASAENLVAAVPGSQWRALGLSIALLLAIAGGAAWLVQRGLASGETWLPIPHASQRRVVARANEPATFWLAIGVYGAGGAGALGLAAWLAREGVRATRG